MEYVFILSIFISTYKEMCVKVSDSENVMKEMKRWIER
jgi:hypothetical protein